MRSNCVVTRFGSWAKKTTSKLSINSWRMYDAEQNLQVRMALLRAFGDSKQKSAVRKLMTIARNDPSVELRKVAVRYLGESKDPEALKFLEDLLK